MGHSHAAGASHIIQRDATQRFTIAGVCLVVLIVAVAFSSARAGIQRKSTS
jgi:hypothetical protein